MSDSSEAGAVSVTAVTVSKASPPALSIAATAAEPDKPVQAYRLKMKGYTVELIAKSMCVCERTIHRWLKQHNEEYATQLQSQPAINVLAEHVSALAEYERLAMEDYRRASGVRDRHSLIKAAASFRQMSIELQLKVGVMPSSASRLHVSVQDASPVARIEEEETKLTKEELMARIVHLVGTQPELPPLDFSEEGRGYGDTENESEELSNS